MKQILRQVTVTGADDSIDPTCLLGLAKVYPFVEFGILCSKNNSGLPRFPSQKWMMGLLDINNNLVHFSMHLCGSWMRQLMFSTSPEIFQNSHNCWVNDYLNIFKRVQLNFHGEPLNQIKLDTLVENLKKFGDKQIIFQLDLVNNNLFRSVDNMSRKLGLEVAGLWDLSHGGGILPENWRLPISENIGYSGGLSPDNLKENLDKLCDIVGETPIWVDFETHARTADNLKFDIPNKVIPFLEIAKDYVIK